MKIFYFTGTGNSLYVAKRIGGELYSIPQVLKEGIEEFEDDVIGIVFPCYAFGVPRLVAEFVKRVKLNANYVFAVMTYGNMGGSGLKHLEDLASSSGITFNYTNEICMVDNYLPLYSIEEQLKHENKKLIEAHVENIVNDIRNHKTKCKRKGIVMDTVSKLVYRFVYENKLDAADKKFIVNENCNACKLCEKLCPKNNISVADKPEFLHHCDICYSCIHNCPQNAIHLKNEKSSMRFINQHVTVNEIISSNDQS